MVKFLFGFNAQKARGLNLKLEELFILKWLVDMESKNLLKYSSIKPGYFLVMHKSIRNHCSECRYNSQRQVNLYMDRLCGIAADCRQDLLYPLQREMLVEVVASDRNPAGTKYRNYYYKFNQAVMQTLRKHEETVSLPVIQAEGLNDWFVELYDEISAVYDFRHACNKDKPTKLMLEAQTYLDEILFHTFLKRHLWDKKWIQKQNTDILDTCDKAIVLQAIEKLKAAKAPHGFLEHVGISLPSFFYNKRNKTSIFILMLQEGQKDLAISFDTVDERANYELEISWLAENTQLDYNSLYNQLHTMYKYFKDNYIGLQERAEKQGDGTAWHKQYGSSFKWKYFVSDLAAFIHARPTAIKWMRMENSTFWYGFIFYVYKLYRVKLVFGDQIFKDKNAG